MYSIFIIFEIIVGLSTKTHIEMFLKWICVLISSEAYVEKIF